MIRQSGAEGFHGRGRRERAEQGAKRFDHPKICQGMELLDAEVNPWSESGTATVRTARKGCQKALMIAPEERKRDAGR